MQGPHERDHHHPPRLSRAAAAAALALVLAPAAHAGRLALPSPAVPLSAEPPLAGGATASAEGVRHRVSARTVVTATVDDRGLPFAVRALQRLDVRVQGDYFFTIGAPVQDVRAAPGSATEPGLRERAIVWAGFDPGRRILAAEAALAPAAARSLPVRIRRTASGTRLENTTGVQVAAYVADAPRAPLLAALSRLRAATARGRAPGAVSVPVTTAAERATVGVEAPLRVRGTIGGRRVDLVLRGSTVVPAHGRVDLRVEPVHEVADIPRLEGRRLFAAVAGAYLAAARTRQYEAFLGNPDPAGQSTTTYVFRTGRRAAAPAASPGAAGRRSWTATALIALGAAAALAAGAAVWARS